MTAPAPTPAPAPVPAPLRLRIEPVIETAEAVSRRVQVELPGHDGLAGAAQSVASAARDAMRVSRNLKRPLSLHRLPVWFLGVALLGLLGWTYWRFFHVAQLTIALPDRDAVVLRDRIQSQTTVSIVPRLVPGSREAVDLVAKGAVDVAFVQGGMDIPPDLPRRESASPELVLWLVRDGRPGPRNVRTVLTSSRGEGSHTVAADFFKAWQVTQEVKWVHGWKSVTDDPKYQIPPDVDAVFVVKDPAEEKTLQAIHRLTSAGFHVRSPNIGARAGNLPYLLPTEIPAAYLHSDPPVPIELVRTYSVKTYLVARKGLTPRLLGEAARLLESRPLDQFDEGARPSVADASEIFQGVEAFLGILVNIGLAFLALLGLEMMTYRKRFHELNSLVSLVSMLQSNKDVLGLGEAPKRAENLLYLSLCSDLLGLLSMISGYYTQENSGLLSNHLAEIVHQRCDGLKINIQLKILHAGVSVPPTERLPASDGNPPAA